MVNGGAVTQEQSIYFHGEIQDSFHVFSDKLGIWMFVFNSCFLNAVNQKKSTAQKRTYLCTTLNQTFC